MAARDLTETRAMGKDVKLVLRDGAQDVRSNVERAEEILLVPHRARRSISKRLSRIGDGHARTKYGNADAVLG